MSNGNSPSNQALVRPVDERMRVLAVDMSAGGEFDPGACATTIGAQESRPTPYRRVRRHLCQSAMSVRNRISIDDSNVGNVVLYQLIRSAMSETPLAGVQRLRILDAP